MQIGPYEIESELARGGMAIVYRARDPRAKRLVALKLLRLQGATQRERFTREVRSLVELRHRYVVAVHDAGEADGYPYLVLELVEGESLMAKLEREGPLEAEAAVEIVARLAEAVAYAHARGILHRDLKPDNVLLDAEGQPRLTDFGLAKFTGADEQEQLSKTGLVSGTPGYLAPEQAAGERARIGPATDVYGLGATLYACLTGRPPVEGGNLVEVLIATREHRPAPPGVDRALDAICLRCLEKEPERRYANVEELERDLLSWKPGSPTSPLLLGGWVGASSLALLLLAGALALRAPAPPASRSAARETLPPVLARASPTPGLAQVTSRDHSAPRAAPTPDPQDAASWLARARAFEESGDWDRSLHALSEALRLRPNLAAAHYRRGLIRQRQTDYEGALEEFTAALVRDPEHHQALLKRATCLIKLGRAEAALRDCDAAIRLRPKSAPAYARRGRALLILPDPAGARQAFQEALRLDPQNEVALTGQLLLDADPAPQADDLVLRGPGELVDWKPGSYVRPKRVVGASELAHDLAGLFDGSRWGVRVARVSAHMLRQGLKSDTPADKVQLTEGLSSCWSTLGKHERGGLTVVMVLSYEREELAERAARLLEASLRWQARQHANNAALARKETVFEDLLEEGRPRGVSYREHLASETKELRAQGWILQIGSLCLEVLHSNPSPSQAELRALDAQVLELVRAYR